MPFLSSLASRASCSTIVRPRRPIHPFPRQPPDLHPPARPGGDRERPHAGPLVDHPRRGPPATGYRTYGVVNTPFSPARAWDCGRATGPTSSRSSANGSPRRRRRRVLGACYRMIREAVEQHPGRSAHLLRSTATSPAQPTPPPRTTRPLPRSRAEEVHLDMKELRGPPHPGGGSVRRGDGRARRHGTTGPSDWWTTTSGTSSRRSPRSGSATGASSSSWPTTARSSTPARPAATRHPHENVLHIPLLLFFPEKEFAAPASARSWTRGT